MRRLPNALTLGNLLCGALAIGAVATDRPLWMAALFVGVGLLCDLLDGRAARALGVAGPFGAQLDSLSDLVSFGVAPVIVLYAWRLEAAGALGLLAAGALVVAAATRLARFTVAISAPPPPGPARFAGLAVTIPAAIILGAAAANLAVSPVLAAWVALGLAALMVSALPYRSFKDRSVAVILVPAVGLSALAVGLSGRLALGVGLAVSVGGLAYALSAPLRALSRRVGGAV